MNASRVRFEPDLLLQALAHHACEGVYRVALSGGVDSTALLLALHAIRHQLKGPVEAIHIHHGFHADADLWQRHCEQLCERLDVPFECVRVTPDLDSGAGPEAELRRQRYRVFEDVLRPGDLLLTAHHQDDLAETVLLHLLRGSGVDGLAGIPGSRPLGEGRLLRPLLRFSREALESFCRGQKTEWIEDPGNSNENLDRVFIRHSVMPLLKTRWPAAVSTLARSAGHCREAADALAETAGIMLDEVLVNARVLDLVPQLIDSPARLKQALRTWTGDTGCPSMPVAKLEEFMRQLSSGAPGSSPQMAWKGWQLRRHQNRLLLQEQAEIQACPELAWDGTGQLELGVGLGTLELQGAAGQQLPMKVNVHPRIEGSGFRRSHDAPMQDVKEHLRTAGVPAWLRPSIPILSADGEVLAIGDWLVAERLQEWLTELHCELRWTPREPVLCWVLSGSHSRLVETVQVLG